MSKNIFLDSIVYKIQFCLRYRFIPSSSKQAIYITLNISIYLFAYIVIQHQFSNYNLSIHHPHQLSILHQTYLSIYLRIQLFSISYAITIYLSIYSYIYRFSICLSSYLLPSCSTPAWDGSSCGSCSARPCRRRNSPSPQKQV